MNECATQPCSNGGLCQDLDGDYNCQCPSPYVGKQCQLREFSITLVHLGSRFVFRAAAQTISHCLFLEVFYLYLILGIDLCPRMHLAAGDGGWRHRGVSNFSILCTLRHSWPSALGPQFGATQ